MSVGAVAAATSVMNGVTGLIGGYNQSRQLEKAARAQQRAITEAKGLENTGFDQAEGFQQPIHQRGMESFQTLADLAQQGVMQGPQQLQNTRTDFRQDLPELQQFSMEDMWADPSIQFTQDQARRATLSAAGAQGRRFSGGTLKELQQNAAGLAGQQGQQAFNRFLQQQQMGQNRGMNLANLGLQGSQQQYNQNLINLQNQQNQRQRSFQNLQGISNFGVNAAGNLGNLATSRGQRLSDLATQSGNVSAQRAMGQGQIFSNTLNNFTNSAGSGLTQYLGGLSGSPAAPAAPVAQSIPMINTQPIGNMSGMPNMNDYRGVS